MVVVLKQKHNNISFSEKRLCARVFLWFDLCSGLLKRAYVNCDVFAPIFVVTTNLRRFNVKTGLSQRPALVPFEKQPPALVQHFIIGII